MQVEDFSDLTKVTTEKLMKLRDIAQDYHDDMQSAELEAWNRLQDINHEIINRTRDAEKTV
uniref:Uncharacterized protein n=1 Tax=Salmonella phage vB_SEnST11_KE23 TaxID=3161174 RepID=A0AAU8GEU7_9CAUD